MIIMCITDFSKKIRGLLILTLLFSAQSVVAESPLQKQLNDYKFKYQQAVEEANKAKTNLQTRQIQLNSANSRLLTLEQERDAEDVKLDRLRATAKKMPGVDLYDQIRQQHDVVYEAGKRYADQAQTVKGLGERIAIDRTQYSIAMERQKGLQSSIEGILNQLAASEFKKRLDKINRSQTVKASVRETCSLQLTVQNCRDQARTKAERKAAENGSVVMVESVTEVKNFNMTKDEIRSRIKVSISNVKVERDEYNLTPDKTGWVVDYAIVATVTPVISSAMRKDMKAQIVSEITGDWRPQSLESFVVTDTQPDSQPVSEPEPEPSQTGYSTTSIEPKAATPPAPVTPKLRGKAWDDPVPTVSSSKSRSRSFPAGDAWTDPPIPAQKRAKKRKPADDAW
jgi:predicted nuclease with TOPRIM domain